MKKTRNENITPWHTWCSNCRHFFVDNIDNLNRPAQVTCHSCGISYVLGHALGGKDYFKWVETLANRELEFRRQYPKGTIRTTQRFDKNGIFTTIVRAWESYESGLGSFKGHKLLAKATLKGMIEPNSGQALAAVEVYEQLGFETADFEK